MVAEPTRSLWFTTPHPRAVSRGGVRWRQTFSPYLELPNQEEPNSRCTRLLPAERAAGAWLVSLAVGFRQGCLSLKWRLLDGTGLAAPLKSHELYHLRVEFTGDRSTLFHNDVPMLNAVDNTYFSGFCGLRTNKTEARFENVDIQAVWSKP